jgi:hypothetical protein
MHKGRGSWPLGDAWSQCSLRPSAGSTGSVDVGDMCNLDGGYVPYQYAHYFIASRSLMRPGGKRTGWIGLVFVIGRTRSAEEEC